MFESKKIKNSVVCLEIPFSDGKKYGIINKNTKIVAECNLYNDINNNKKNTPY